jgi:protein-S-isoprenylcysteine O-methyltransferase Ste14
VGRIAPLLIDAWLWIALLAYWQVSSYFTHENRQRETWLRRLEYAIPLYLGGALVFVKRTYGPLDYPLYGSNSVRWLGTFIAAAGLVFAVWARITIGRYWDGFVALKHDHRIICTGPYAIVRHPIYTGYIVGLLGSAISAARVDAFAGVAILTISFVVKYRREERVMTKEFGETYTRYLRQTPALFPLGSGRKA